MAIPLFDTETPLAPLRPRIVEKVTEGINAGRYVLGPEVRAFEAEFAAYLGVAHVVGVANGTDASRDANVSPAPIARGETFLPTGRPPKRK